MVDRIPEESDWGDWRNDVDRRYSYLKYCGRSNEEMGEHFISAPLEAASELRFMPRAPFQYYVIGYRDSVLSRQHDELVLPNAASCFLRLVLDKVKNHKDDVLPIIDLLLPAVETIAQDQLAYDADLDIYGDFEELAVEIKSEAAQAPRP